MSAEFSGAGGAGGGSPLIYTNDPIAKNVTIPYEHPHVAILKKYIQMKFDQSDWHGVSDGANDLRELIAKLDVEKKK